MTLSRIIIGLLQLIQENTELVNTIKNILEIFPDAVIIEGTHEETENMVVKYANRSATQSLFDGNSYNNIPLNNKDLNLKVIVHQNSKLDEGPVDTYENENDEGIKFSSLLDNHKAKLDENLTQATTTFTLIRDEDEKSSTTENDFYSVTTVKVSWGTDNNSFMHVFSDITNTKKLEKEKATNK